MLRPMYRLCLNITIKRYNDYCSQTIIQLFGYIHGEISYFSEFWVFFGISVVSLNEANCKKYKLK